MNREERTRLKDHLKDFKAANHLPHTVVDRYGNKCWYLDNRYHRKDGPAVELVCGSKEWWVNGSRHREDGPAIEWSNGTKYWYLNGQRHRKDGPAVEFLDGTKQWWYHNIFICDTNQKDFLKWLERHR